MFRGLVSPDEMTTSQRDKRERVLEAAVRLLVDETPDRVSVKAVSVESGVALATIYRFFASKDHLLAAALLHWEAPLEQAAAALADADLSPVDRLVAIVRRGTRSYLRIPNMLACMVYAATSTDPQVREIMVELRLSTERALRSQMIDVPADQQHLLSEIIQALWWDLLVAWHGGRQTLTQGLDQVNQAIHLVFAGLVAPRSTPPAGDSRPHRARGRRAPSVPD
ncbi:TetR/AcrR family transcriptional regulator [Fodinicola feengrottensis]|nr:TetR/AcrR family transcriptional regulator [Fodinicola feengrottensis]